MLNFDYEPHYIWPNPAFPFREYFTHPNLRIFIIENISHNWLWLKDNSRRFQERDFFYVYCGWYLSDWFLKKDLEVFEALELDKSKFYFLFNSNDEMCRYKEAGFNGELINQNAWLDWHNGAAVIKNIEKKYDAIYVARPIAFKRHYLASKVNNLALITGPLHGATKIEELPNYIYRNDKELTPEEVFIKINESHVGLILSEEEGACFASSEYLLCGVPVVSTKSRGGRDVWYDETNSIIVDPYIDDVSSAVIQLLNKKIDPQIIRENHISLATHFRQKFIDHLSNIFKNNCVNLDPQDIFRDKFFHKLRESLNPDFRSIWP